MDRGFLRPIELPTLLEQPLLADLGAPGRYPCSI